MEVDFSGSDDLTAMPEGRYVVVVQSMTEKTGVKSGKDYVEWIFEVLDGEFQGRKLFNNTSLQPQALWKFKETLVALGISIKKNKAKFTDKDVLGLKCEVLVGQREWDGQLRNEVRQVLPMSGGSRKSAKGTGKGRTTKSSAGKGRKTRGF